MKNLQVVRCDLVRRIFQKYLCQSEVSYVILQYAMKDLRGKNLASFYFSQVLPCISRMSSKNRNMIMLQLLRSPSLLRFEDVNLKAALSKIAFVPCGVEEKKKGEEKEEERLAAPSSLFTPMSSELTTLLSPRDFPCKTFCENDVLGSLVELGLRTSISRSDMLNIARDIESSASSSKSSAALNRLAQRSLRLVEYIESKEKKIDLRRRKKSVGLFSFFLGDNREEENIKQEKMDREFFTKLRKIAFLPILVESSMKDLPWCTKFSQFCCAEDARPKRDMVLCSATKSIVAFNNVSESQLKLFGWDKSIDAVTLALQLVSIARLDVTDISEELRDVVRTIYKKLNNHVMMMERNKKEIGGVVTPDSSKTQKDTIEEVKLISVLSDTPWILIENGTFAKPQFCAFAGLEVRPYLFTVSNSPHSRDLFRKFGVRDKFFTSDYVASLKMMSKSKGSNEMNIDVAIQIANLISDDAKISDYEVFLPDVNGEFIQSTELIVDDMPWRENKDTSERLVHEKIGLKVAKRLGVKSLRETLVLDSSESFGVPFGQKECLTRRLSNILEQYAEGITPLFEFIQNADDAGARNVKIVFSSVQFGDKSLISKSMKSWQGPSILVYNDAMFSDADFRNIARIGQGSKMASLEKTGRFGLGFNSAYHFTDCVSFVSQSSFCVFDPHLKYIPQTREPGLRVNFVKNSNLREQFSDQFDPYCIFGNDMKKSFKGK